MTVARRAFVNAVRGSRKVRFAVLVKSEDDESVVIVLHATTTTLSQQCYLLDNLWMTTV